ncbi:MULTISPECIES: hypothetical protein [Lacticaseibacillus]|uniref:Uncharacterized protein n=2 Tax=Lacticaseibacillus TaxID=2759736 RepID=A0AAN1C686_LACCA|nr:MULTISPECIES: hypothetical protein [Lacticaseibacillus]ARY90354.1 hypothetical protein BGL52_00705 [Lacticaseibacillus casei]KAB1969901.1 hypothetical protein F9B82_05935 [Lacticaseibacillus casei]WLV80972.1 hypothetical protein LACSTY_000141 [Lacticaseibacillus sp. NCIMB 15473]WNX24931.1 hypothetical protein RWA15_00705 [Lacticaseibacillus casei]WNX27702.1 hypothetical protein RWA16_00705 [Lacticaseibacillus casei]
MTTTKLIWICVIIGSLIGWLAEQLANLVDNSALAWMIKISAIAVAALIASILGHHFDKKKNSNSQV